MGGSLLPVPPRRLFYIIFSNNNHSYRNRSSPLLPFCSSGAVGWHWLSPPRPLAPPRAAVCVCRSPSIKEREERRSSRVSLAPFFSPGGNSSLTTAILTPNPSCGIALPEAPPSPPTLSLHPLLSPRPPKLLITPHNCLLTRLFDLSRVFKRARPLRPPPSLRRHQKPALSLSLSGTC